MFSRCVGCFAAHAASIVSAINAASRLIKEALTPKAVIAVGSQPASIEGRKQGIFSSGGGSNHGTRMKFCVASAAEMSLLTDWV